MLEYYLKDPNFNKHNKVIELFHYLCVNLNNKDQLIKEIVFVRLYPHEKFQDSKLRHIMSYLLKKVEEFGYLQIEKRDFYDTMFRQLSFYDSRSFVKGFDEVASVIEKIDKSRDVQTNQENYSQYNIYSLLYNNALKSKRTEIELLGALNSSLDKFFVLSKLKVACSVLNQQTIFNQTINNAFFKEIIEYTRKSYLSDPMISLYYYLYVLMQDGQVLNYQLARDLFQRCIIIQNKEEIKDALLLLINYCIKQINQGDKTFEKEVLEYYKIGISNEILLENKKLSPFTYGNAVNISIKKGELEWVNFFIEKYRFSLDTELAEDYYSLNKSKLLFAEKKYEEALEFINRSLIQDLLSQLQLRVIQIKIFIELDEYQLAASFIDNLKQMLKRKNILSYHKENFKKIAKYILKVIQLAPYSKIEKEKLKQEILQQKVLSEKGWLLEKLQ